MDVNFDDCVSKAVAHVKGVSPHGQTDAGQAWATLAVALALDKLAKAVEKFSGDTHRDGAGE